MEQKSRSKWQIRDSTTYPNRPRHWDTWQFMIFGRKNQIFWDPIIFVKTIYTVILFLHFSQHPNRPLAYKFIELIISKFYKTTSNQKKKKKPNNKKKHKHQMSNFHRIFTRWWGKWRLWEMTKGWENGRQRRGRLRVGEAVEGIASGVVLCLFGWFASIPGLKAFAIDGDGGRESRVVVWAVPYARVLR